MRLQGAGRKGQLRRSRYLAAINKWFAENTQNMIPQMLAELSAEARIVLANALYFKRWQQTFKPDLTKPGPFRISGTEPALVPLADFEYSAEARR